MSDHKPGCPAMQAWDIPGACNCDGPEYEQKTATGKLWGTVDWTCPHCNEEVRSEMEGAGIPPEDLDCDDCEKTTKVDWS